MSMKRLRPELLPRRCECGKLRCRSIEHARHVHGIIWAAKGGPTEIRVYQCEFSGWHWTRQTDPNYHQPKAVA